jgi:acetylornithine deacetylase/succinyl-diaminopimelate desuccinylase-like protein
MCNGIVMSCPEPELKIQDHQKNEENKDFKFWQNIHTANERIPIEALTFGADVIFKVLRRFEK